jgi:hypothetical protein
MANFTDIVDESSKLTLDEQESFVDILKKRIIEQKRQIIIDEAIQSREEFESENKVTSNIDDILYEIQS